MLLFQLYRYNYNIYNTNIVFSMLSLSCQDFFCYYFINFLLLFREFFVIIFVNFLLLFLGAVVVVIVW